MTCLFSIGKQVPHSHLYFIFVRLNLNNLNPHYLTNVRSSLLVLWHEACITSNIAESNLVFCFFTRHFLVKKNIVLWNLQVMIFEKCFRLHATEESYAHPIYKKMMIEFDSTEYTDIFGRARWPNAPQRVLQTTSGNFFLLMKMK